MSDVPYDGVPLIVGVKDDDTDTVVVCVPDTVKDDDDDTVMVGEAVGVGDTVSVGPAV